MGYHVRRRLLFALCLLSGTVLSVRSDDLLNEVKIRREIAIQALESDIRDILREAEKQIVSDPKAAASQIDTAQNLLDEQNVLNSSKKESWQRRIKTLRTSLAKGEGSSAYPSRNGTPTFTGRPRPDTTKNDDRTRSSLAELNRLKDDGKLDERASRAEALAKADPDSVYMQFAARQARLDGNRAKSVKDREEYSKSTLSNMNDIDRASAPQVADVTLPDDWAEKSKRRSAAMQMSPKQRNLMKALTSPVSVDLTGRNFQTFQDEMEKHLGVPFVLDRAAMDQMSVTSETTLNLKARNWAGRSVMRKVLADLGLTYVIRNDELLITVPERAKELMITRAYYVGDLVTTQNLIGGWPVNQAMMMQTINGIIESIKSQVDGDSWAPKGNGTIFFDPISMSIMVKQTAEVHFQLGSK